MKYYYDLHTHSCLSPCGDSDNTPNNIAGMAKLCGLDIIALTDHNSCKNCPGFFEACHRYGIVPIAGMELTTSEDIHLVCLFPTLEQALSFDREIEGHRMPMKNRPELFGEQIIMDGEDNIVGCEDALLSYATDLSVDDAPALVNRFGGVCYPAHIDRSSNGIIAVLGTVPHHIGFKCYELREPSKDMDIRKRYGLDNMLMISSSDAHYLGDVNEQENFLVLPDGLQGDGIVSALFAILRGEDKA